jgi:hypothetical protein
MTDPPVDSDLEAEFAALADESMDWANLTAGSVSESWPDA